MNSNDTDKLSLSKKGSSSESNLFGNIYEDSDIKNNNSKLERLSDEEDEIAKKFGNSNYSIKDNKNNNKKEDKENKSNNEEEDESNDEESYELKEIEEDSFNKKKEKKESKENKDKKRDKKKDKNKDKIKDKKNKMKIIFKDEISEDNEKMSMEYSSSDTFIKTKYPKKNNKYNKEKKNKSDKKKIKGRFETDFKKIRKLGQGGEGAVFEVMNYWDRQKYAIKRMKIEVDEELNEVTDTIKKEVYFLSRNRCPYIVRYYQTWVEEYNKSDLKDDSDLDEFDDSTIHRKPSFDEISKNTLDKNELNSKLVYASDGIVDDNTSEEEESEDNKESNDEEHEEDENNGVNGNGLGIWDDDDEEEDNLEKEKEKTKKKKKIKKNIFSKSKRYNKNKKNEKIKILYIQMELCENNTLRDAIDKGQLKNVDSKWKLISQILEGVNYIHDNGYIHRDLKPGNIFLDKENTVKIGDFGLVQLYDKKKKEMNNKNNSSPFNTFSNYNNLQCVNFGGELLTVGIGTKYYCSPEQEKSENYDNKTDIYSLGIIIFEMFYKFNSYMERDITLRQIKDEQKYPKDMEKKCGKNVSMLVKKCTSYSPDSRPSIKDLIKSKLIPSFLDKQKILNQFKKDFLEKNVKLINEFINILIERKKKVFSDYNKYNNNTNINSNNQIQEENLNEIKTTHKKGKEKKKDINENEKLINFDDDFYSSLFSPLTKLLDLNPNKNMNDSSIYSLSLFEKFRFKIQSILNQYNAFYLKLSEFELYYNYNDFCFYNSNEKKFCKIYLKQNNSECASTESGLLLSKSKNMFNNLNKIITIVYNSRFYNSFMPVSFYYDSSGALYNAYPISGSKEYIEYNDIICSSIWKESDNLFDYDSKYIINNLRIILNILNDFGFISKNIEIRINSSVILDVIYDHFLNKKYSNEKLEEIKIKTLLIISSLLNKRDYQYGIDDLTKLLNENRILNEMPIPVNELIELIKFYELEKKDPKKAQKKNLEMAEEREKRINEENLISSYFEDLYWESNNIYLSKYKNKIFIDYTLIPENLQFYSGFFLQVCYKRDKTILPLIEGGIIDNYLFDNEKKDEKIKGFSFIVYMKNIFELKIKALSKNRNNMNFLYDCLIIRTHENVQIKLLNDLGKICLEEKLKYLIIYKPQDKNIDFKKYFSLYRMKQLIAINLVEKIEEEEEEKEKEKEKEKDKGKERKEKRKEKWKEKKEKEKEKEKEKNKENEREQEEINEVTYTCETWYKSKLKILENLNLQEVKNNFKIYSNFSNN